MSPLFARRPPSPPVNVRLLLDDNSEVPVSCVYDGKIDGLHQWRVILPKHPGPFVGLAADSLPGRSTIGIPKRTEEG